MVTKTPGYTAAAPARGLRRLISLKETRIQSYSFCGGFSTRGRGTAEVGLRDRPRRGELQASQAISSPPLQHAHITSNLQQSYVIRLALPEGFRPVNPPTRIKDQGLQHIGELNHPY